MSFVARRKKLRNFIRKAEADALLVTNFKNVTYLTGFTGDDSYLLVTLDGETLDHRPAVHDAARRRMPRLAARSSRAGRDDARSASTKAIERREGRAAGNRRQLGDAVACSNRSPRRCRRSSSSSTENLVERLRIVKDKDEIDATRVACQQARRAFDVVRAKLTPSMTELDVAAELEYQARRFGAKALSFPADRRRRAARRAAARHAHSTAAERERLHAHRLGRELRALHERLDANDGDR